MKHQRKLIDLDLVYEYMLNCRGEHIDPKTDELNTTRLAEDACDHFNGYICNIIPDEFFDLANEIDTEYRLEQKENEQ